MQGGCRTDEGPAWLFVEQCPADRIDLTADTTVEVGLTGFDHEIAAFERRIILHRSLQN